jgi:hypothetical protein
VTFRTLLCRPKTFREGKNEEDDMLSLILAATVTAATIGSADPLAPCGGPALQCTASAAAPATSVGDEAAGPAEAGIEAPQAAAEVESPSALQSKDATTFGGGYGTWFNPCPWSAPFQHCNVYGSCFCSIWP